MSKLSCGHRFVVAGVCDQDPLQDKGVLVARPSQLIPGREPVCRSPCAVPSSRWPVRRGQRTGKTSLTKDGQTQPGCSSSERHTGSTEAPAASPSAQHRCLHFSRFLPQGRPQSSSQSPSLLLHKPELRPPPLRLHGSRTPVPNHLSGFSNMLSF